MSASEYDRKLAADVVRSLVARFPHAADDAEFAEAALRDLLGDAHRRERALLVAAARAGLPARVRDNAPAANEPLTFDANADDARWAVDAWRAAFGDATRPIATLQENTTVPTERTTTPARPGRARAALAWVGAALVAGAIGFIAFRPHSTPDDSTVALASPTPQATATIDYSIFLATPKPTPLVTVAPRALAHPQPRGTTAFDFFFKSTPPPTLRPRIHTVAVSRPLPTFAPRAVQTAPPERSIAFARPSATRAPASTHAVPVRSFGYAPGADLSDASAQLGECVGAWRAHDWTAAKAACARAAAATPNDPEPVLLLGESYYGCHCYDGALAPLGRVIDDASATPSQRLEAYRYRGFVDYELYNRDGDIKDLEWAYYDFGGALDIDDRDPTTMFDYGSSAYTLHHWCAAQRAFGTLASRYPFDRESAYWRDAAAAAANREGCS